MDHHYGDLSSDVITRAEVMEPGYSLVVHKDMGSLWGGHLSDVMTSGNGFISRTKTWGMMK